MRKLLDRIERWMMPTQIADADQRELTLNALCDKVELAARLYGVHETQILNELDRRFAAARRALGRPR